jgi:hypothetical protein
VYLLSGRSPSERQVGGGHLSPTAANRTSRPGQEPSLKGIAGSGLSTSVTVDRIALTRRGAPRSQSRRVSCSREMKVRRTARGQPQSGGGAGDPAHCLDLPERARAAETNRRSAIGIHQSRNGQSDHHRTSVSKMAALRTRSMRPIRLKNAVFHQCFQPPSFWGILIRNAVRNECAASTNRWSGCNVKSHSAPLPTTNEE